MIARTSIGFLAVVAGAMLCSSAGAEEPVVVVGEATVSQDPGAACVDDPDALDGKALHFPVTEEVYYRWPEFPRNAIGLTIRAF